MNRLKCIFLTIVLVFVVSGCATEAVSPMQATEVPSTRITNGKYLTQQAGLASSVLTFVRDSGLYGVGVTIYLFIDGEEIAGFRPSESLQIYVPPGEYLVGVQSKPNFGMEQFVETPSRFDASKKYSFRIGIDYNKAIVQRTSAF